MQQSIHYSLMLYLQGTEEDRKKKILSLIDKLIVEYNNLPSANYIKLLTTDED